MLKRGRTPSPPWDSEEYLMNERPSRKRQNRCSEHDTASVVPMIEMEEDIVADSSSQTQKCMDGDMQEVQRNRDHPTNMEEILTREQYDQQIIQAAVSEALGILYPAPNSFTCEKVARRWRCTVEYYGMTFGTVHGYMTAEDAKTGCAGLLVEYMERLKKGEEELSEPEELQWTKAGIRNSTPLWNNIRTLCIRHELVIPHACRFFVQEYEHKGIQRISCWIRCWGGMVFSVEHKRDSTEDQVKEAVQTKMYKYLLTKKERADGFWTIKNPRDYVPVQIDTQAMIDSKLHDLCGRLGLKTPPDRDYRCLNTSKSKSRGIHHFRCDIDCWGVLRLHTKQEWSTKALAKAEVRTILYEHLLEHGSPLSDETVAAYKERVQGVLKNSVQTRFGLKKTRKLGVSSGFNVKFSHKGLKNCAKLSAPQDLNDQLESMALDPRPDAASSSVIQQEQLQAVDTIQNLLLGLEKKSVGAGGSVLEKVLFNLACDQLKLDGVNAKENAEKKTTKTKAVKTKDTESEVGVTDGAGMECGGLKKGGSDGDDMEL